MTHAVPPHRPRRRRRGIGGCVTALALLVVVAAGAGVLLLNTMVKPMVGDAAVGNLRDSMRSELQSQISAGIPDVAAGEVTVTDREINDRIAKRGNLGPVDDVAVHITPDGLVVDLHAYGMSGTYRADVVQQDGSLILVRDTLDGPLSWVVPDDDLAQTINTELANALSAAGYRVDAVTLGDGEMTVQLTGTT
jgi:hypothetical protein